MAGRLPLGNHSSLQELHKEAARLAELLLSKQLGKLTVLACSTERRHSVNEEVVLAPEDTPAHGVTVVSHRLPDATTTELL